MLAVAQTNSNAFQNYRCGEVFCISPAVYNVTCCLCASKMHLDQFPSHFQIQHLTLAEQSINLEELELKRKAKLAKDANLLDNMTLKEEDPEDDPIKQEEFMGDKDEDDKSLQQLARETAKASLNQKEEEQSDIELAHIDIENKLEVEVKVKKPNTRKSQRVKYKEDISDDNKEFEKVLAFNDKKPTDDSEDDLNKLEYKDDEYTDEDDDDDMDIDKDWAEDGKVTDSHSVVNKNITTDELPFPCLICKRSYRSKHSLQKHNYSVHNPNKPPRKRKPKAEHKCDECGELFRSARNLLSHKWKHTGIFCDICGKPFTQAGTMIRHKIRHTGIKDHKCKECNKEFFTNKELKSHMICHTGMTIVCEICGKRCRDHGVLTAHMRRHTGERPAKCNVCGKSFFSFHDLNIHAVTHSSERPFKCDICGSTFQRKKSLRVHKKIHSKDRNHVCKICGKGFAQSGGLNSHMRTHDAALENSSILLDISSIHTENQTILSTATADKRRNITEVGGNAEEVNIMDMVYVLN